MFRNSNPRPATISSLLRLQYERIHSYHALCLGLALRLTPQPPGPPSAVRVPFVETFHRGSQTLIYVAATHHSSVLYPNVMDDPVFKTIESVFATSPPDAVIVEGVDPSIGIPRYLDHVKSCAAANYDLPGTDCDEPAFAAYCASKIGASVSTGEPSASALLSVFKSHGYSIQDFFAFWIMSNIPQAKRHGQLTAQNFPKLVDRIVRWHNRLLGTSVPFTTENFAAWYAKNMQTPRNYLDIVQEDGNPYPPPEEPKTMLHTLSALSTKARDENVVATIRTTLATHYRVLVVYGSGHLDFEWNDLIQLMGVPIQTKPF